MDKIPKKKFKYEDPDFMIKQKEYRRKYYQDNKERISKYQTDYYYSIMSYYKKKNLKWRGAKRKNLSKTKGKYVLDFS